MAADTKTLSPRRVGPPVEDKKEKGLNIFSAILEDRKGFGDHNIAFEEM